VAEEAATWLEERNIEEAEKRRSRAWAWLLSEALALLAPRAFS